MSTGTNKERLEQNNELLIQLKEDIDNLPDASSEILTKDENGVCVIENKINSAVVYGNSQQDENIEVVNNQLTLKQSGKNVLPFINQDFTLNDVRYYVKNGSLYFDGTSSGETSSKNAKFKEQFNFTLNAGTYIISQKQPYVNATYLYDYDNDASTMLILGNEEQQFTLTKQTKLYIGFYVYRKVFNNVNTEIMIRPNNTDAIYNRYIESKNYSINLSNNYLAKVNDVKDELWIKSNGEYGKTERIKHIASYNGETITTDYISSTGALTTGAEIYYVSENEEEKSIGVLVEPIKLWEGTNIFELESNIPTNFEINYYKT